MSLGTLSTSDSCHDNARQTALFGAVSLLKMIRHSLLLVVAVGCSQSVWTTRPACWHSTLHPATNERTYVNIDLNWLGQFPFDDSRGSNADIPVDRLALNNS